jgi:hypothetical protein
LITRQESYTKHAEPRAHDPASDGVRAQLARDILLGICGSAYLALVLFDDVQSPLLSMALIFLVAYELIQPHLRNR